MYTLKIDTLGTSPDASFTGKAERRAGQSDPFDWYQSRSAASIPRAGPVQLCAEGCARRSSVPGSQVPLLGRSKLIDFTSKGGKPFLGYSVVDLQWNLNHFVWQSLAVLS